MAGEGIDPLEGSPNTTHQRLDRLRKLSKNTVTDLDDAEDWGREIERCLASINTAKSYATWQAFGDSKTRSDWLLELVIDFVAPDRYRVQQRAGDDFDEFITIGCRQYNTLGWETGIESPYSEPREDVLRLHENMRIERYAPLLREATPTAASRCVHEGEALLLLEYAAVSAEMVSQIHSPFEGTSVTGRFLLWISTASGNLSKVEAFMRVTETGSDDVIVRMEQIFTHQNEPIEIHPPSRESPAVPANRFEARAAPRATWWYFRSLSVAVAASVGCFWLAGKQAFGGGLASYLKVAGGIFVFLSIVFLLATIFAVLGMMEETNWE